MLEAVDDEGGQRVALQDLVVVDADLLHCVQTLDLREQDERAQVVLREHDFFEFAEFFEFGQVLVVHDQVEADVDEVNLLNQVIELRPLQNFKRIPINVKHLVPFNLSVARLHQRLFPKPRDLLVRLLIQPIDFPLPFFLDDFDHVALVLGFVLCSLNNVTVLADTALSFVSGGLDLRVRLTADRWFA